MDSGRGQCVARRIGPAATIQDVVVGTAFERVVPQTTGQRVVAFLAPERCSGGRRQRGVDGQRIIPARSIDIDLLDRRSCDSRGDLGRIGVNPDCPGNRPHRDRVGQPRAVDAECAADERVLHQIDQVYRDRGRVGLVERVGNLHRECERRVGFEVQLRPVGHRDHARVVDRKRPPLIPRQDEIIQHIVGLDLAHCHRGHHRPVRRVLRQTHHRRRIRNHRRLIHIHHRNHEHLVERQTLTIRHSYRHTMRHVQLIVQQ